MCHVSVDCKTHRVEVGGFSEQEDPGSTCRGGCAPQGDLNFLPLQPSPL